MEIRIRSTGQVMLEEEFRAYQQANGGPTWNRTTDEILEALGADPVFEGPQVGNLEFWQFSLRSGVENVDGKWYTKYIPGPLFYDTEEATAAQQQAAYIAQKQAEKNSALMRSIQEQTQQRLDNFAQTRNYAGMLSLCTYATSTSEKFKAEGQYGVEARDQTWSKLYEILAEVEAGTRPVPTGYAEVEPELPPLAWPV